MAVTTAVAVGIAVLLAAGVAYAVVRGELRGQVDDQLADQARLLQGVADRLRPEIARRLGEPGFGGPAPPGRLRGVPGLPAERGGTAAYIQFLPEGGDDSLRLGTGPELPGGARARAGAAGGARQVSADDHVKGDHVRVLTVP